MPHSVLTAGMQGSTNNGEERLMATHSWHAVLFFSPTAMNGGRAVPREEVRFHGDTISQVTQTQSFTKPSAKDADGAMEIEVATSQTQSFTKPSAKDAEGTFEEATSRTQNFTKPPADAAGASRVATNQTQWSRTHSDGQVGQGQITDQYPTDSAECLVCCGDNESDNGERNSRDRVLFTAGLLEQAMFLPADRVPGG